MKIIVSNNIRIKQPDEKIKEYAETNLVIENPDYIRLKRLNKWTGNTSKYLVWYQINEDELILPFGCLADLFKMYSLELFENRIVLGKHIDYKSNINLFDYQQSVCEKAVLRKNGIIVMPQIAKILDKINEDEIQQNELKKRIIILLIIFVICIIFECGYMKDTQEGIIKIYNSMK